MAAPFRIGEFDLISGEGASLTGETLILGEKHGLIKKSGATYSYESTKLGSGYEKAKQFLKENPKLLDEIVKKIKSAAAAKD